MKRSLLAIAAAGALAVVLAGGAFFALKFTASGAVVGPISMSSIPGNPASGVSGQTMGLDCNGGTIPCPVPLTLGVTGPSPFNAGLLPVTGIAAFNAMNPPPYVAIAYYGAKDCALVSQAAVLVTDPLGPGAANLRVIDSATKTGLLITPANTPYVGGTAGVLSAGVVVVAGDFQCGDNVDSDGDGDINDGCAAVVAAEAVCETSCADADGQRPWDNCDDDADGAINDGCPANGGVEVVVIQDPANNQYLACGNADATPVTGWDGLLGADWKLLVFEFVIDADATNGTAPCDPIDATNTVDVGDPHEVAVCTQNEPDKATPPGKDDTNAFSFNFTYDDDLNSCVSPDCGKVAACANDDNPDANVGSSLGSGSPTSPNLGTGWDCSVSGTTEPVCSAGTGSMACFSIAGPYTSGGLSPFPLAVIEFTAIAAGTDTIVTDTNVWSGVESGELNPASVSGDVVKEPPPPTDTPTPTNTPVPPTDTPTATPVPEGIRMEKDCDTVTAGIQTNCNLWLMAPDLGCPNAAEGKGCLVINKVVAEACDGDSPNDLDTVPEGVGAWEEQIKYDHKIVRLTAEPNEAYLESGGRIAYCTMTILTENWILTGCVTKDGGAGWGAPGPGNDCETNPDGGSGIIETITVAPMTDDLIYRQGFRPGKDNGVVTDIVDENCELADTLGEGLPGGLPGGLTQVCGDVHLTVRMLEGDLNLDCAVTVLDDQAIAFRYGTFFGLALYDEWYDLGPECVDVGGGQIVCYGLPDFDIDIKDLQFVFGRNYSTCQVPIPDNQLPVAPPQP